MKIFTYDTEKTKESMTYRGITIEWPLELEQELMQMHGINLRDEYQTFIDEELKINPI